MWRYAAPQRGRYREHWQLSVEGIGSDDPALDAEIIHLYDTLLKNLGALEYTLESPHVRFSDALFEYAAPSFSARRPLLEAVFDLTRRVFAEVDALRNSNYGLAVPLSAGFDLKFASLGQACALYAVAAGTIVYYQNLRTEREYVEAGPVPGVTLGCGRLRANAIVVLRPSHQPVAVIAASITIRRGLTADGSMKDRTFSTKAG